MSCYSSPAGQDTEPRVSPRAAHRLPCLSTAVANANPDGPSLCKRLLLSDPRMTLGAMQGWGEVIWKKLSIPGTFSVKYYLRIERKSPS